MQSSKATERDGRDEPASVSLPGVPSNDQGVRAMPYVPSAPCAACARGVDPLRAACLSVTDTSVHYFCSRACRVSYLQREASLDLVVANPARAPGERPAPSERSEPVRPRSSATLEPVARRIAPTKATTPLWPMFASVGCLLVAVLPLAGADELGVLALTGVSAVFASRASLTRRRGGVVAWLAAPLAVPLLGLAALLGQSLPVRLGLAFPHACLLGAVLAVVVMWWREHTLERAQAAEAALRSELAARLSPRARVSTRRSLDEADGSAPRAVSDRALASLQVGDELLLEAGSVVPVDGVVLAGEADVLPYPSARLAVSRKPGSTVLAGALLTEGSLRLVATRVGDQRALFRVLVHEPTYGMAEGGALALGQRLRSLQFGACAVGVLTILTLVSPQPLAAKLASLGGALALLPLLALAGGISGAYRRALVTASTRGIQYRDAASLERAARMDTAVLRVEGTLVPRSYTLLEIASLSDTHDASALLALALAGEACAKDDGIAEAVRAYASHLGVAPATLRRVAHTRGTGVSGLTDGQGALVFGSRAALLGAGVSVAVADREAQRAELLGQRVVFLALGGRARGLFVFAQSVRAEATVALQALFDLGLEVALVSGDHRTTVEAIARTLDIRQVKAELSAEQRAAEVRRLRDGEARVAVIGRLPEDPSLLAAADVSICVDATGQTAEHDVVFDVTTASPDLRDAAVALALPRQVRSDVRCVEALSATAAFLALLTGLGVLAPALSMLAALALDFPCLARGSRLRALFGRRAVAREDDVARGG